MEKYNFWQKIFFEYQGKGWEGEGSRNVIKNVYGWLTGVGRIWKVTKNMRYQRRTRGSLEKTDQCGRKLILDVGDRRF